MNVGKVKLYILDTAKPIMGFVTVSGVMLVDAQQKPLMGAGFAPLRVKHGDSIRIDIVDPEAEKKEDAK